MSNKLKNNQYYLELDENCYPKINHGEILQLEKDSTLTIEILNGYKTTNQINLLSNLNKNFSFSFQEKIFNPDNIISAENITKYSISPKEISTSIKYEIQLKKPGPIIFFFIYTDDETKSQQKTKPFYINIIPKIEISKKINIDLKNIRLLTVLSKSLGNIDEFEKIFIEAKVLNYNFIHFTPVQELGSTNSSYSIKNHTEISDYFFLNNKHLLDSNQKYELFQTNIKKYSAKYNIGTVIDIILHQTSSNSHWLYKHPECGYNLVNTPWLNCAYDLDNILQNFSNKFALSKTKLDFQPYCHDEKELYIIINEISNLIENANLYEYFMINENLMNNNLNKYYDENIGNKNNLKDNFKEKDILNFLYSECLCKLGEKRNGVLIDISKFEKYLLYLINNSENKEKFLESMSKLINNCNTKWKNNVSKMIINSIQNIKTDIYVNFIQNGNYKSNLISHPLIMSYFTKLKINEKDKNKIFACNGLLLKENTNDIIEEILSLPSIYNYVKNDIYYYFQRKILIWSDSAKLKFPYDLHDCHFLIKYMTNYVQEMAQIFNGFVLHDIDSIPVTIIQYLMKKAREINPNLIIISKINNHQNEIELINKIGINLLIKELIICNNNNDLVDILNNFNENTNQNENIIYSYTKNNLIKKKYLLSSKPYNIIFDLTNENITYYQKTKNLFLNLTNMFCCSLSNTAIGTTKGFDELYAFQPSMVNEKRKYFFDKNFLKLIEKEENPIKKDILNKKIKVKFELKCKCSTVHLALSNRGWVPDIKLIKIGSEYFTTEIYLPINQKIYYKYVLNSSIWICDNTKDKEEDNQGNINNYILVKDNEEKREKYHYNDLKIIRRKLNKLKNNITDITNKFNFKEQNEFLYSFKNLNDFSGYAFICHSGYKNENKNGNNKTIIEIPGIYESFIVGCSIINIGEINIEELKNNEYISGIKSDIFYIEEENYFRKYCNINLDINNCKTKLIFNDSINTPSNILFVIKYNLSNLIKNAFITIDNNLLRMEKEWYTVNKKLNISDINYILYNKDNENYNLENYGKLKYGGISHIHKILNEFQLVSNNKNNKVLDNIIKNDSLFKFIVDRLYHKHHLKDIFLWLNSIYNNYVKIPNEYKITYLTRIINCLYNITILKLFDIYKNEALINYYSPFNQNLLKAIPQFISNNENNNLLFNNFQFNSELSNNKSILANTREIFISFKGIFLIPGLFNEAKNIIIYFSSKIKNGIIPNIILNVNNNTNFIYNSKDVTWLYLKSLIEYIEFTKNYDFLQKIITIESNKITLYEIIQEILQKHINGISIKEDNNNIDIYIDQKNGFIYGENKNNCGTWMDCVNEKGQSYTPRDGANIEIVSLVYYVLNKINYLYNIGKYKYDYVLLKDNNQFKLSEWINKIKDNFENYFYNDNKANKNYIRNIYKDYISANNENDPFQYQLRPNVFIALVLSPELFNKEHVLKYISKAERFLIDENSLGIKTLSINDKNYKSTLDNKNKNNLHNGIEWIFLYSYYLMSKHIFENNNKNSKKNIHQIYEKLLPIQKYLLKSEWSSLPSYNIPKNDLYPNSISIAAFLELIEFLRNLKNSPKNNITPNSSRISQKKSKNKCLLKAKSIDDIRNKKKERKVSFNQENINNEINKEEKEKKNITNNVESPRDIPLKNNENNINNSIKNTTIESIQPNKSIETLKKEKEPTPDIFKHKKQLSFNTNENIINKIISNDENNNNNIKSEKTTEIKEIKKRINHSKIARTKNIIKKSDNILNNSDNKTKKKHDNSINNFNNINDSDFINNSTPITPIINNNESVKVKGFSDKVTKKIYISENKDKSKKYTFNKKQKEENNVPYDNHILNRNKTEKNIFSKTKIKLIRLQKKNKSQKNSFDDTSSDNVYYNLVRSFDLIAFRDEEESNENNEKEKEKQENNKEENNNKIEKIKIKEGEGLLDLDADINDLFMNSFNTPSKKNIIRKKKKTRKKRCKKNKSNFSISTPDTSNLVSISTDFNNLIGVGIDTFDPTHTPENSYSKNVLYKHKRYNSNLIMDTSDDFLNNLNSEDKSNECLENNVFPIIQNKDNENIDNNEDIDKDNIVNYLNNDEMSEDKKIDNKGTKKILYEKKILSGSKKININHKTFKNLTVKDLMENNDGNRETDKK